MFETTDGEPRQRPIDRRREQTRREILDAAWTLCRQRGLAGLSLRELAEAVGMRAPSLYSYFPSKDAIYDVMFAEGQRQLGEALRPFLDRQRSGGEVTRDDIHAGTRAFFEFCVSDPVRYQLMFQRTIPGFEPSAESYALAIEQLEHMNASLTAAGFRDGRLLDLMTAVMSGLISQQLTNDPGGDRWARLLEEAIDLLCDHAGVPPRTPPTRRTRR